MSCDIFILYILFEKSDLGGLELLEINLVSLYQQWRGLVVYFSFLMYLIQNVKFFLKYFPKSFFWYIIEWNDQFYVSTHLF